MGTGPAAGLARVYECVECSLSALHNVRANSTACTPRGGYDDLHYTRQCNKLFRMIVSFKSKVAKDIWTTNQSKTLPRDLWIRAKALLTIMHATSTLDDLRIKGEPPSIRLHKLPTKLSPGR